MAGEPDDSPNGSAALRPHSGGRRRRLRDELWRGHRLRRLGRWVLDEQAEHDAVGSGGAWREKPTPPLPPEGFADFLIGGPALPARYRWDQIYAGEPVG